VLGNFVEVVCEDREPVEQLVLAIGFTVVVLVLLKLGKSGVCGEGGVGEEGGPGDNSSDDKQEVVFHDIYY
jgi:hypothetical protein